MKQVKKVPVILQMEAVECGAASLAMVLAYYKRYIPLEKMRIDCNVSRDGSTAKYIVKAARNHGLTAKAFRMEAERVRKRTDFPMILHWNFNHFVVLCGFKKDRAVINDPAAGKVLVGWEEFQKAFTGIALTFAPGEDFETTGQQSSAKIFLRKRLKGYGLPIFYVMIIGSLYGALNMLAPVFYRIFTDRILLGNASEWFVPLISAMLTVCLAGVLTGGLKYILLARLRAKMMLGNASGFMWKLLRLPAAFFSQRFCGDIVSRGDSNDEIAEVLFKQLLPTLLDGIMMILIFLIMLGFDTRMALLGLSGCLINMGLIFAVSRYNLNEARNIQRDDGKLAGMMVSSISMIETIKASGAENGMLEKIMGYQAKYSNGLLKVTERNLYIGILPELICGLCNAAILVIGIESIFAGKMTIGMLVAFQGFVNLFFSPMDAIVECIQSYQDMVGSMDRISDVMEYEEDISEEACLYGEELAEEQGKLTGAISIKNIRFGYSPVADPQIWDFSLEVQPGEMIALVGGSGSGKSTLAKLLAGLYQPNCGEILFDGKSHREIDHYVFTGSVAVVDQSISLFSGTIMDNITMWDETIDEKTVMDACRDACIHEEIMMRKGGYQYVLRENGSDFSGGQRQRMEIARAFASNPSILILDEATSALDTATEKKIMDAVKRRKITCIVIAHRLSTIRDADEIIYLEKGHIVERGTHKELLAVGGAYEKLVKSD